MSNSTIIPTRPQDKPVSETFFRKIRWLITGIRRGENSGTSFLDTGHLDDHVLKDIGLDRLDLTKPE